MRNTPEEEVMPTIYYVTSIIVAGLALWSYIIVYSQTPSKEQKTLQLVSVCNLLFCIFDAVAATGTSSDVCEFALYLSFIGASNIGMCYMMLLGMITHVELPRKFNIFCVYVNFFFSAMAITNRLHHLMYRSVSYEILEHGSPLRHLEFGPLFWIYLAWYCGCMIIPFFMVYNCAKKKPFVFRDMKVSIVVFFVTGGLAFGTFVLCDALNTRYDFSAISSCTGVLILLLTIYKYRIYPLREDSENAVLNNLEDILIAVDNNSGLIYANQKARELVDVSSAFAYGIKIRGIYADLDKILDYNRDETILYKGRYYTNEVIDIVNNNYILGKIHWLKDITKEQNYIHDSEVLKEKADIANRAKGHFLAHMSHEIRTPINAILGMNEIISRETDDANIRDYSDTISRNGKTLLAIINDILDFSKIEEGKLKITPAEYDLALAIKDLTNMARTRAVGKSLIISTNINENLPRNLFGDEVRVKQVISNILTNAVKYTIRGTVDFNVDFEKTGDNRITLIVEVKDTGVGIRQEDLPKLFERFERLDNNDNRKTEGTGLGMGITKSLLDLMDGHIEVESEYGRGSCFKVFIPQETVSDEIIGTYHEEDIKDTNTKTGCTFTAPEAEILVVDDNTINRLVAVSLLKRTNVKTDQADSGIACLEMVRKKHYDLILLDFRMPGMNGSDTLVKIREDKNSKCYTTPVIAMTADADEESRTFFFECGFNGYLTKPIDAEAYEQMVHDYLPPEKVMEIKQ